MAETKIFVTPPRLQQALDQVRDRVVRKETGKGLSTNDLTDELKQAYDQAVQKVANLEATGGQANVIEKIKVNGVEQQVGSAKDVNLTIPTGALADKDQVAESDLDTTLAQKLNNKADQSAVNTLIGSDAGKSVRTIANEELAAQLIPESASDALDTLQEIAQWIQEHPDDASAMNTALNQLKALVGTLPEGITSTNVVAYIKEYCDGELTAYVKAEELVPVTEAEIEAMFASWN